MYSCCFFFRNNNYTRIKPQFLLALSMLSNSSRQYMKLVQTNSRETSNGVTLADDNMTWVMIRDVYCIKENANRVIRSL